MNFLTPAFLLGLPLVAVPVIIHLLSKRQQTRISWGAMRFLKAAATRKRRLWRLTDLLLLILRTAAFLFFILALARPLFLSTWMGGGVPREIILVLDQSMSMSRRQGDASLFELQLQKATEILKELQPKDSIRVLLAGETPEWLTEEPVDASAASITKLKAQLNALKPTLGAGDLVTCVREAADLEAAKDKSAKVIVVITDGQRFGWHMDEAPLWTAIKTRVESAAIPSSVNLQLVGDPSLSTANLCINQIESQRQVIAINQPASFTAHVQNRGLEQSSPTLLRWQAGRESLGVTTLPELAPGASTTVSISHQFPVAGIGEVSCQLESKDALLGDNQASFLVEVMERIPVLLVEESNATDPLERDSAFVLAGLGARKVINGEKSNGWHSVFEPTVITPGALETTPLERYRGVVLLNVRQLASAAIQKLDAYVRSGGGVWITLGEGIDPTYFNDNFYSGGRGLSPLRLATPIGDADNRDKFFTVRAASDSHPATKLLADLQRLDLDKARIYRRHQFDIGSGRDVSVLVQVQQDDPVVVERKLDQGRVLVQSVPLGVAWSSLPLSQAYVAMLHEWLWYLSEPTLPRRDLAVGEILQESIANTTTQGQLRLPDGRSVELQPVDAGSGPQLRFSGTRLPGEYVLQVPVDKAKTNEARFLVQRNTEESDLTSLSDQDKEQLRATNVVQIGGKFDSSAAGGKVDVPKHPAEGWLLVALACVLLGEMALAGWMTQRRHLRLRPVAMQA